MMRSQVWRQSLLVAALWLVAVCVFAQTKPAQPLEPQPGQPGKDVQWLPTQQALVETMLNLARVTPRDYLIDLGSGEGRIVIAAAKRGARAYGIEYNADLVELSRRNAARQGVARRATFAKADLFESDLSRATVVTMFLLPELNMKLRPKLLDLRPGTRIVSNTFAMEDWQPDDALAIPDCEFWCTALLWIVPAKVGGSWQLPGGALTLTQQFQMVSGTFEFARITNGKLRGDQISFTVGQDRFAGRVSGDTIQGTLTSGGTTRTWRAIRTAQRNAADTKR